MKLALLLNVIDSSIGGVLIMGHRGTGKSTAVRAMADLLPPIARVEGCLYGCDPTAAATLCASCRASEGKFKSQRKPVQVVELPLGATEDRICGTIDIERALKDGIKAFEPGLLARANRGFLYIDEVNLLEDHLVDLLLDVAVTGRNVIEREGISIEHPARFVLIGSGNPEEGELRPQLVDRFGLHVEVKTELDPDQRVQIVLNREEFERDTEQFSSKFQGEQKRLRTRLTAARNNFSEVGIPRPLLRSIAEICIQLNVDGHRGELTITRAARALAAYERRQEVSVEDVRRVAAMSLLHRLRRDPLDRTSGGSRIEQALDDTLPPIQYRERSDRSGLAKSTSQRVERAPMDSRADAESNGSDGDRSRKQVTGYGPEASRDNNISVAGEPAQARVNATTLPTTSWRDGSSMERSSPSRSRGAGQRTVWSDRRGRYAGASPLPVQNRKVALDATIRATACSIRKESRPLSIGAGDLRYKRFKQKKGRLFIFAIDLSGSMALNRIAHAKGAIGRLLKKSYIRRDSIAIVTFRQKGAAAVLSPSKSIARARRLLDALSVGGGTPLAAGLLCSLEIARRARRLGQQEIALLLFTDGRANIPLHEGEFEDRETRQRAIDAEIQSLGAELRTARVSAVVVDTQNPFRSLGEARALARLLGASYTSLSPIDGLASSLETKYEPETKLLVGAC
jgi:magnesium chelatase subunit D